MSQINFLVCGYGTSIDYKNDKIIIEEAIPKQIEANINNYLKTEGFLDEDYINLRKETYEDSEGYRED